MDKYNIPNRFENPLARNQALNQLKAFAFIHPGVMVIDGSKSPYEINPGDSEDVPQPKFISKLGTLIYSNFILNAGRQIINNNVVFAWEDFRVDDALFLVTQQKKLVETEIQGKDGVVVEYIGLGPFQIQITGRITGSYNVYEKELVAQLKKILSCGQPLAITSWYLQNLDITDIIVKSFDFGQNEGEYSTQYFTINAQSDQVTEAFITNQ